MIDFLKHIIFVYPKQMTCLHKEYRDLRDIKICKRCNVYHSHNYKDNIFLNIFCLFFDLFLIIFILLLFYKILNYELF